MLFSLFLSKFQKLQQLQNIWGSDFFHALAKVKKEKVEEIRKQHLTGVLSLTLWEQVKWWWVSWRRYWGCPYSYIFYETNFLGHDFYVDRRVLVPRVETEELALLAIEKIKEKIKSNTKSQSSEEIRILDIGTGSGVIAISVILELLNFFKREATALNFTEMTPKLKITVKGLDVSAVAIKVAKRNQKILLPFFIYEKILSESNISLNLEFSVGDIFSKKVMREIERNPFDIIISNPPYISTDSKENFFLSKEVRRYEPSRALWGGGDGLDFYRHFSIQGGWLRKKGVWLLELGVGQGSEGKQLFLEQGYQVDQVRLIKDMFGKERFLEAVKL